MLHRRFRPMLLLVAFLVMASPLQASALTYGLGAKGVTDAGSVIPADGSAVSAWVYGLEGWFTVVTEKVNSIYAYNIYGDQVEVGIDWPGGSNAFPLSFTVNDGGPLGYQERWLNVYPTEGTYFALKLKRYTDVNPDSFDWSYYVAGTRKGTWYDTGMRSAIMLYGSERVSLLDNGNLSFRYLQYLPFRGSTWSYVPNVQVDSGVQNNDPDYHWNFSGIDSSYHNITVVHD